MREVSERLQTEEGERLPTSTLVRIEQGKLDPGVRRLHLLLRLYDLPAHLVADVVQMEQLAAEEPAGKDLESLYLEGVECLKRGDIYQGLANLFAVRLNSPQDEDDESRLLRQRATLAFASAARDTGKVQLAKYLLDDLLCEPPEESLLVDTLVQASVVWNALGSHQVALALARQAATHVEEDDHERLARVRHQEAKLLLRGGDHEAARETVESAIELYRAMNDTVGEVRAMLVSAQALEAARDVPGAIRTARKAVQMADEQGYELLAAAGRLELGRVLVQSGELKTGIRELRRAQATAVLHEDKNSEFHAHFNLWKAYDQAGDRERSRFEYQAARYFLEFINPSTPEAREMSQLVAREERQIRRRRGTR